MTREERRHLQKYCDISNWSVMQHPKTGKENYEAAKELYEDILRLCVQREKGEDGTAVVLAAFAMARSVLRKAVALSPAFDYESPRDIRDDYENLFKGDFWMNMRDDGIMEEVLDFICDRETPFEKIL